MELELYLDELEKKLIRSFDILRNHRVDNEEYDLFARYHLRAEKYFLTKSAKIYAMENNEYILVKRVENLDTNEFKRFTDNMVRSIDELVELHDEHMSSIITGVILVDKPLNEIDGNVLRSIEKFRYHKGFSFGFKGWVDIRIILTSLEDGSNIANKKGREVSEIYGFTR
ncbi:hypothetical protein [Gudongella sp. SC589]|jgi:hypothetical protein|uniref:hypothetical protein n=1 Tax=Gudongella sp. SC589 TaxID=3385990 RepID=UPI003904D47E